MSGAPWRRGRRTWTEASGPPAGPEEATMPGGLPGSCPLHLPTPGTPPQSQTERWRVGEEEGHCNSHLPHESALPWEPQECPDNTVYWSSVQGIYLWRRQSGRKKHQDPRFAEKGPAGRRISLKNRAAGYSAPNHFSKRDFCGINAGTVRGLCLHSKFSVKCMVGMGPG